ncbi:MAG: hypothetical protein SF069_02930 [Phycisphaerae bacterium]|nr:hypothetical protein [Phycisphaerae bacterium]
MTRSLHKPVLVYPPRGEHPLAAGLVAFWPFAEGSGLRVSDANGRFHGTLAGMTAANAWKAGDRGWCLKLDGAAGRITTSARQFGSTNLLAQSGQAFTFAMRFAATIDTAGYIVSRATTTNLAFAVLCDFGDTYIYLRGAAGETSFGGLLDGRPHDLVIVWDGAAAAAYWDGQLLGALTVGAQGEPSQDLLFGALRHSSPLIFGDAGYDYAAIWQRALTAKEIALLSAEPWALVSPPADVRAVFSPVIEQGYHALLRWSGEIEPLPEHPELIGSDRVAEIVGLAGGDLTAIAEFPGTAKAADTIYHYAPVQVSPGGKATRVRREQVVTRVTDGAGNWRGLMPNPPAHLHAQLLAGYVPLLRWNYSHAFEQTPPAGGFKVFSATKAAAFDFNAPLATVPYIEGKTLYEYVGTALTPGDERYYIVRAAAADGTLSLIPRVGLGPSGSYLSVDKVDCAYLAVRGGPPAALTSAIAEVTP